MDTTKQDAKPEGVSPAPPHSEAFKRDAVRLVTAESYTFAAAAKGRRRERSDAAVVAKEVWPGVASVRRECHWAPSNNSLNRGRSSSACGSTSPNSLPPTLRSVHDVA
jgi:hypothetical protein